MDKVKLKIKDMKNNVNHEGSVVVAELNGFLHVFTADGECLPFNTNTLIKDCVDEVMTVTATFKCRLGEVVK